MVRSRPPLTTDQLVLAGPCFNRSWFNALHCLKRLNRDAL